MTLKIRLACGGSKNRHHYRIVVANSRSPRDGKFIEKLGTWSPTLPKEDPMRFTMNFERIQHWIKMGAQPTDRIMFFMDKAGLIKRPPKNNPIKAKAKKKTLERLAAKKNAEEQAIA
ncbi:30S ribosomal protein S16 [Candidatus Liberibacter africanus]|uniref:Small ribosomal subunit protein bS16 n=1 Tax=Candidatus Liberibacter africanus PTSAPSY TaxID=1277257 RepID=A0A0G3I462_LIBAF|nr:30S ribosomal protein S16 [Candidatus Liberibacter africanus]AKK20010.1 30S ribosomal protein S16 [Candidatus Liberibacter africanus PTSAPSY]QTP63839.1 30S ribosomal protein S16 [Candidatus Liberibacter africanus]